MLKRCLLIPICLVGFINVFAQQPKSPDKPPAIEFNSQATFYHTPLVGGGTETIFVKVQLKVNSRAKKQVLEFVIPAPGLPLKSGPVILNPDTTINTRKLAGNTVDISLRIKLNLVNCLTSDESFDLVLNGQADKKQPVVLKKNFVPASTYIRLRQGSIVVKPRIKGTDDPGTRTILLPFELSGAPGSALPLPLLALPGYTNTAPLSKPSLDKNASIVIPTTSFNVPDGCAKNITVPVLIQLAEVTSLPQDESFSIVLAGNLDSAYQVVVQQGASSVRAASSTPATAPAKTDSGFTFACGNGTVLTVEPFTNKAGELTKIRVRDSIHKKVGEYRVFRHYDPANFAIWVYQYFAPRITMDCANYLADRFSNLGNDQPLAIAPVDTVATTAAKPATKAADSLVKKTEKSDKAAALGIRLDNKTSVIHPVYKSSDSIKLETVKVYLIRDSLPSGNDTVVFRLDKTNFPKPASDEDSFSVFSSTGTAVVITKKQWKKDKNSKEIAGDTSRYYTQVSLIVQNPSIDTTHEDWIANIRIPGDDKGFHAIRLTEKGTYNSSYPFWVELGTNFDLLDGISMNNLYSGVYMFEKDIARFSLRRKSHRTNNPNNLSFTGGVYESRSSSFNKTSDSGLVYRNGTSYTQTPSGYPYYRDTGAVAVNSQVTSIGIFFSPHLRLTNTPTDQNGYHQFFSIYAEMLWQRVKSSYDYKDANRYDILHTENLSTLYTIPFKEKSLSTDYRSHYFGVGLPIYIKENMFTLYINNVFGISNQKFIPVQDGIAPDSAEFHLPKNMTPAFLSSYLPPKKRWNGFYLLQFRLNDEKYGISFTGEVRGFFLKGSAPVISMALSKKFDLADLFNTIVKPFTPGK